jgi:aminopeptidase-like protein
MSKRALSPSICINNKNLEKRRLLDIISYCDGKHSLLDIAEKIDVPAWDLYEQVDKLIQHDLIYQIK